MRYIWYIDEGFLVWIIPSRYQFHESIYWARATSCHFYTSHSLMPLSCSCMFVRMTQFSMHAFCTRIYQYTRAYPCTPLGIHHTTRWGVSDSPGYSCPDLEHGAYGFPRLLIRVAQRKRGSSTDRLRPYPSRPPYSTLEFFCYDSEPSFVQFIIVYLFVFSHLLLSVM